MSLPAGDMALKEELHGYRFLGDRRPECRSCSGNYAAGGNPSGWNLPTLLMRPSFSVNRSPASFRADLSREAERLPGASRAEFRMWPVHGGGGRRARLLPGVQHSGSTGDGDSKRYGAASLAAPTKPFPDSGPSSSRLPHMRSKTRMQPHAMLKQRS